MLTNKIKLNVKLETKRIVRTGLDNAYKKLDSWYEIREQLLKEHKNISLIDYKICHLENEIETVEESIDFYN